MKHQPTAWICSYDIRHPKRLYKIHNLLCRIGIAINYSVFYLLLSYTQIKALANKIAKIIYPQDDVRFYPSAALHEAHVLGNASPTGIFLLNAQGTCL